MKIDYIKHGDICLPALKAPEGTYEIGKRNIAKRNYF